MSGYPYIGSKISLISKSDLRYEGTLFTIDPANSTVALSNVRCFGTEDRRPDVTPPSDALYNFIVFKGSDIKNLVVCEAEEDATDLPPPDDPAIVRTSTALSPSASDRPKPVQSINPVESIVEPMQRLSYNDRKPAPSRPPDDASQTLKQAAMSQQYIPSYAPQYAPSGPYSPYYPPHQQYYPPHLQQGAPNYYHPAYGPPARHMMPPRPQQQLPVHPQYQRMPQHPPVNIPQHNQQYVQQPTSRPTFPQSSYLDPRQLPQSIPPKAAQVPIPLSSHLGPRQFPQSIPSETARVPVSQFPSQSQDHMASPERVVSPPQVSQRSRSKSPQRSVPSHGSQQLPTRNYQQFVQTNTQNSSQSYSGPGTASFLQSHRFNRVPRTSSAEESTTIEADEFDIQSSNARFDKQSFMKSLTSPVSASEDDNVDSKSAGPDASAPSTSDPDTTFKKYDKSSFFDDISLDRDERGKRDNRRGKNEETFGNIAAGYSGSQFGRQNRSNRRRQGGGYSNSRLERDDRRQQGNRNQEQLTTSSPRGGSSSRRYRQRQHRQQGKASENREVANRNDRDQSNRRAESSRPGPSSSVSGAD